MFLRPEKHVGEKHCLAYRLGFALLFLLSDTSHMSNRDSHYLASVFDVWNFTLDSMGHNPDQEEEEIVALPPNAKDLATFDDCAAALNQVWSSLDNATRGITPMRAFK